MSGGNQIQIVHKKRKNEGGASAATAEEGDAEAAETAAAAASTPSSPSSMAAVSKKLSVRQRRTRVPDRPNLSISLWSIVKNSIGKDLTKIPVPVNFSEPLSMLQRLTEDFEYSDILHHAAQVEDDCEQVRTVSRDGVNGGSISYSPSIPGRDDRKGSTIW